MRKLGDIAAHMRRVAELVNAADSKSVAVRAVVRERISAATLVCTMQRVEQLWNRLAKMEAERRFADQPYPCGMCPFPFRLAGQGFFPGGDGLWRDDCDLATSSTGQLPNAGVMFLGNDFGTLTSYRKLQARGYENPPTWRHLKSRISLAEIPPGLCFCTNAIMGLRTTGTALRKQVWDEAPNFLKFCREFLIFQVETLQPKLLVVLGPVARTSVDALVGTAATQRDQVAIGQHTMMVLYASHPYADFALSEEKKQQRSDELRKAWLRCLH